MDGNVKILYMRDWAEVHDSGHVYTIAFKDYEIGLDNYCNESGIPAITIARLREMHGLPSQREMWRENIGMGFYDYRKTEKEQKKIQDY